MEAEQTEIRIDPDIESLIQPLSSEEFAHLEQSILEWGACRDKAVVWLEERILLDGHHRKRICDAHGMLLPFELRSFHDRNAAKLWVLKNQLARRNLSPYQKAELALAMDPFLAAQAKKRQVLAGKKKLPQNSAEAGETREKIADLAGVSHDTVAKVKLIREKATDELREAVRRDEISVSAAAEIAKSGTPELQRAFASGELSARDAKRLAQLKPEDQRTKLDRGSTGKPKRTKVRSDQWPIDEVVSRADGCLRVWSRVSYYGKLYDPADKVNEFEVRRLYRAFKSRMKDKATELPMWREMVQRFIEPFQFMASLAAAELGETKRRRKAS
jgi:hypothetical protein